MRHFRPRRVSDKICRWMFNRQCLSCWLCMWRHPCRLFWKRFEGNSSWYTTLHNRTVTTNINPKYNCNFLTFLLGCYRITNWAKLSLTGFLGGCLTCTNLTWDATKSQGSKRTALKVPQKYQSCCYLKTNFVKFTIKCSSACTASRCFHSTTMKSLVWCPDRSTSSVRYTHCKLLKSFMGWP